jgi:hypothetical protein
MHVLAFLGHSPTKEKQCAYLFRSILRLVFEVRS